MNCQSLLGLLLVLILQHTHFSDGLRLGFGEDDFSLNEQDGPLKVPVVVMGDFSGSVTIEVVPMTTTQFLKQGLTPLPDTLSDPDLDPAEAGDDFNDDVHTFTLQERSEISVEIDIVDDDISEHAEIFLLILRVVNASEGVEINVGRNISVVRIRQDSKDASRMKVGFSKDSLEVTEGDGLMNSTLFIDVEGMAEPILHVQLTIDKGDDVHLLQSVISIPSGARRVPVPIEIIDDEIAEELQEYCRVSISVSHEQRALFGTGSVATVFITITDNDRPHFGFEVQSAAGVSSLQLLEGQRTEVCLLLLEPKEFDTFADISVQLPPDSGSLLAVEGLDNRGYFFTSDDLRFCFNVTAIENDMINEPKTIVLSLAPKPVLGFPGEVEWIDTDNLQIIIRDNDGIPRAPGEVKLRLTNGGKDLLVTWKSEPSDLQPISQYRVSIETTNAVNPREGSSHSRRQTITNEANVKEYVTTDTELLLENVESGKTYTIQVCAENDLGHACASATEFSIKEQEGKLAVLVMSDGLGSSDETTEASLPLGYIVAIILLPLILVLVCCILTASVIICSCCRYNAKHYYPSEQEKKMAKQVELGMDGRYRVKSSSTESIDSTTNSVSDFTPV